MPDGGQRSGGSRAAVDVAELDWAAALNRMRTRILYVALALATIAIGLAVHVLGPPSSVARDVVGDALWASMIVWWISALMPASGLVVRGAIAFLICVGVELSQLYHAPWLDALRGTRVGHLVLGSGFDPRDFLSYAAGVIAALLLVPIARKWGQSPIRPNVGSDSN